MHSATSSRNKNANHDWKAICSNLSSTDRAAVTSFTQASLVVKWPISSNTASNSSLQHLSVSCRLQQTVLSYLGGGFGWCGRVHVRNISSRLCSSPPSVWLGVNKHRCRSPQSCSITLTVSRACNHWGYGHVKLLLLTTQLQPLNL